MNKEFLQKKIEELTKNKNYLVKLIKEANNEILSTALFNDIRRLDGEISCLELKIYENDKFKTSISTPEGLRDFIRDVVKINFNL